MAVGDERRRRRGSLGRAKSRRTMLCVIWQDTQLVLGQVLGHVLAMRMEDQARGGIEDKGHTQLHESLLDKGISELETEKRCLVTHFRMLRREMDESCCRMSETIGANWSALLWDFCCVELLLGLRSALLRL